MTPTPRSFIQSVSHTYVMCILIRSLIDIHNLEDVSNIGKQVGAIVLEPHRLLCISDICPTMSPDGDPLYKDIHHMRPFYVRNYVLFLDDIVR